MIPSIDDRIATMITALQTIILPALPEADSVAREQARLMIGHLAILREQVDHAPAFERIELQQHVALATALAGCASGGPSTFAAAASLAGLAEASGGIRHPVKVREACEAIDAGIEMLVTAAHADGDQACRDQINRLVLDHVETRTPVDRAWFAGAGFEQDRNVLPAINELMQQLEAIYGA